MKHDEGDNNVHERENKIINVAEYNHTEIQKGIITERQDIDVVVVLYGQPNKEREEYQFNEHGQRDPYGQRVLHGEIEQINQSNTRTNPHQQTSQKVASGSVLIIH